MLDRQCFEMQSTDCDSALLIRLDNIQSRHFAACNVIIFTQVLPKQGGPLAVTPSHTPVMSDSVRYLFYNYDNLAYITTLHHPPHIATVFTRIVCELASEIRQKRKYPVYSLHIQCTVHSVHNPNM